METRGSGSHDTLVCHTLTCWKLPCDGVWLATIKHLYNRLRVQIALPSYLQCKHLKSNTDKRHLCNIDNLGTFPTCITTTDLRPDIVLWSPIQKSAILVELTLCYETNFEDAHRRKANKYEDLVEAGRSNGFDTSMHCNPRSWQPSFSKPWWLQMPVFKPQELQQ